MGDDTGYPSSMYPGGSEDDFNKLRAKIAQLETDKAQLTADNEQMKKELAWHNGEGHAAGCPQGYHNCKCGKAQP
jgi:hypothetical protein